VHRPAGAADSDSCRHQLELKSQLLESIGDALIAHSLDGKIVYANERAAEMLGYGHPEFVALSDWEWIAPELRDNIDSHIARIRDNAGLVFETRCHGRDGLVVAVETHSRVVSVDPWGELIVSVSRDMTERQTAHETMRRHGPRRLQARQ
jgi:PAS domain S-box-containing protein